MKALQSEMKEMRYEGQLYYKKKIINLATQRLNSILVCGDPHCKREFNKKCNMQDHLRTHSGNKPYVCEHCRKGFKQKAQLYKHKNNHVGGLTITGDSCISNKHDETNEENEHKITMPIVSFYIYSLTLHIIGLIS